MSRILQNGGGLPSSGLPRLLPALLLLLTIIFPALAPAADVPPLKGRVNDHARILSPDVASRLERRLSELERRESTQIVVLTVSSLGGEPIESFGIRVAEAWKIGQRGIDNGAILIVAVQDRKVRIEVGRGLEEKLTDLAASLIIRNEIVPRFRQGDYSAGIVQGVRAIEEVVTGMYAPRKSVRQSARSHAPAPFTLLVGALVIIVILGSLSRLLGGIVGGVALPAAVSFLSPGLGIMTLAILALAGFILGLVIPLLFGPRGGGPFFFGGGGFGGFSGGGGSFGGFSGAGGGFGGGGASGDW